VVELSKALKKKKRKRVSKVRAESNHYKIKKKVKRNKRKES
jgi:hypothetical protein